MPPGPNFKDKLKGHKAIIIGGSRGIGLGVAEAFLASGASVHIIGRTAAHLHNALALLKDEYVPTKEEGTPVLTVEGEVSDVTDEDKITASLRAVGPVDHVVYTAVDGRIRGPIGKVDIERDQDLFGVKFWGQVTVAKAIANYHIIKPGGSYTITSGSLSIKPKSGAAVGGALNAAVNTLAKGLAIDLAPKKVRVNCVVPGYVISPHETRSPERDAYIERLGESLLTGFGVGSTEDIAEAYLYFARARFTTVAIVDGGALLVD
ncbi:NAD(P)-binding protein [Rickenella mellea]|uniref:NAD(P)-binding protein n=1 Tax=Rickenella mellea TaxID=50990 RepID=A0A4Y7PWB3_9AGAM|nr:NAD(P)-binding protein [Rickenella mellea]